MVLILNIGKFIFLLFFYAFYFIPFSSLVRVMCAYAPVGL